MRLSARFLDMRGHGMAGQEILRRVTRFAKVLAPAALITVLPAIASPAAAGLTTSPGAPQPVDVVIPVSYTHLDVYKRQVPHLAVAGLEEQHHRQQLIHHHPRRQRALALLTHASLADHPVDQLRREHRRQHADPDPVRQPVPGHHLLPWPRHANDLTPTQD